MVKQEDIKIPFLNKPKNNSSTSLIGHIDVQDDTLIQRISSFRTVIRRLEVRFYLITFLILLINFNLFIYLKINNNNINKLMIINLN